MPLTIQGLGARTVYTGGSHFVTVALTQSWPAGHMTQYRDPSLFKEITF